MWNLNDYIIDYALAINQKTDTPKDYIAKPNIYIFFKWTERNNINFDSYKELITKLNNVQDDILKAYLIDAFNELEERENKK